MEGLSSLTGIVISLKRWSFPLMVIGANSIAAYCMDHFFPNFIASAWKTNLGQNVFLLFGSPYEPFFRGVAILLSLWLILYWPYQRKIFLKT